eukprot:6885751-Alexandrium_andersonii.AAC.1
MRLGRAPAANARDCAPSCVLALRPQQAHFSHAAWRPGRVWRCAPELRPDKCAAIAIALRQPLIGRPLR